MARPPTQTFDEVWSLRTRKWRSLQLPDDDARPLASMPAIAEQFGLTPPQIAEIAEQFGLTPPRIAEIAEQFGLTPPQIGATWEPLRSWATASRSTRSGDDAILDRLVSIGAAPDHQELNSSRRPQEYLSLPSPTNTGPVTNTKNELRVAPRKVAVGGRGSLNRLV